MRTTKERNRRPPPPAAQSISFPKEGGPPDESLDKAGTEADDGEGRLAPPGEGSLDRCTVPEQFRQYPWYWAEAATALLKLVTNDDETSVVEPINDDRALTTKPPCDAVILIKAVSLEEEASQPPLCAAVYSAKAPLGGTLIRLSTWAEGVEGRGARATVRLVRVNPDGSPKPAGQATGAQDIERLGLSELYRNTMPNQMQCLRRRIPSLSQEERFDRLQKVVCTIIEKFLTGRLTVDQLLVALRCAYLRVRSALRDETKAGVRFDKNVLEIARELGWEDLSDRGHLLTALAALLAREEGDPAEKSEARVRRVRQELETLAKSARRWTRETASYLLLCLNELRLPTAKGLAAHRNVSVSTAGREMKKVVDLLTRRLRR